MVLSCSNDGGITEDDPVFRNQKGGVIWIPSQKANTHRAIQTEGLTTNSPIVDEARSRMPSSEYNFTQQKGNYISNTYVRHWNLTIEEFYNAKNVWSIYSLYIVGEAEWSKIDLLVEWTKLPYTKYLLQEEDWTDPSGRHRFDYILQRAGEGEYEEIRINTNKDTGEIVR